MSNITRIYMLKKTCRDNSKLPFNSESIVEEDILKQWPFVSVQFEEIEDNLGNTYLVNGNGGRSEDHGVSFKSSDIIKVIEPSATSLKLVPIIYFSLGSGKGLETKEMEPITIELQ